MQFRIKLLPTLSLCILSIFSTFWFVHNHRDSFKPHSSSAIVKKEISNNSLIFYRTYWEQIDSSSVRIRILTFSKCFLQNSTNFLMIELNSSEGSGGNINDNQKQQKKLKTEIQSIERECPWAWATGCKWNSFVIDSYTTLGDIENNNNIIVTNQDKSSVTLQLIKGTDNYEDGISICIPPLYWYSDWLKLSFFIEVWRLSAGTNAHFYFYIQSISKTVEAVLKEYESQGILTIIEWPMLPNSTEENPNESIYRFGHLLAQNDCRYRIKHRFAVVVDVDELILPLKQPFTESLTEYLKTKMKIHPLSGSFLFKHSRLRFPNWPKTTKEWNLNGFEWIEKAMVEEKEGPTKAIFIPDRTDLISTHKIRKHFGIFSAVEIPPNEAKLFHFRKNWTYKESDADYETEIFKQFKYNISISINSTLTKVEKNLLSNGLKLNNSAESLVSSCLKKWHDVGCKTPYTSCFEKLSKVDEWFIPNSFPYTVL